VDARVDETGLTRISVGVDDVEECPPMDLCAVVDISGSMGASCAGISDGRTQYVEAGFSLLDLVKHAFKTIVNVMRPQDRLAFIIFDELTEVQFDFMEVTDDIRSIATETIDALEGRGSTDAY